MKTKIIHSLLLVALLLPLLFSITQATGPDTLWTREFGYGILGAPEEGFEFHPTNDSIFIYTGRTYINDVKNDTFAVHFVNTITGQEYLRYGPIHDAHFTPDGKFLIGHNDSTLAYISLDSMKPVRSYPVVYNLLKKFTIDEKGKYVYSVYNLKTDTGRIIGFNRWDIENGTVQGVALPDSLLEIDQNGCPVTSVAIRNILVSDTAKILLMEIFVDRPYPFCPAETRVWAIDLTADTIKYDLLKLHPTYRDADLDKILPKRTQFIGSGWKYENNIESGFRRIFDVATGAEIEDMYGIFGINYTFSEDETYTISFGDVFTPFENKMIVYNFSYRDTVYTYNNINVGPIVISPNNEFILQHASTKFVLYSTPWYPTSVIKQKDEEVITISPNPAADYIEINIPRWRWGEHHSAMFTVDNSASFRVFDILGIEQSTPSVLRTATPQEGNLKINVSGLPPGVYFVRVGNVVRKFVKM